MDFQQMQERARSVRARYAEVEASAYGRSWTTEEIMLGFLGDVDLAGAFTSTMDELDTVLAED
jgi:hypothetical protein